MESEDDAVRLRSLVPSLDLTDIDRLQHLYAPFRPRDLNPKGFDEKLRFWFDAIQIICSLKNSSLISLQSLQKDLQFGDQVPRCLDSVLSELRGAKKILPLWHDGSWSSWAMDMAHSRVFNIKPNDSFIHVESLDKVMDDFKRWIRDQSELTHQNWCYTQLKKPFSERNDIEHCLKRLASSGEVSIIQMDSGITWLRSPLNTNAVPPVYQSEEEALLKLVMASQVIKTRLKELEEKETVAMSRTKDLLQKGQRDRAKNQLLKTKRIRKSLLDNDTLLDKIEGLLEAVSVSRDQREVMSSLKAGNEAVKRSVLNVEDVEEMMDEVKETLELSKEISDAMSVSDEAGDESLLAELDELERLDKDDADLADAMEKLNIPADPLPKSSRPLPEKKVAQLAS